MTRSFNTIRAAAAVSLALAGCAAGCGPSRFRLDRNLENPGSVAARPADWKFWWGVSTASYQSEDAGSPEECRDFKTDWDLMHEAGKLPEPRGDGMWSYSCVDRDIAALRELGATHYRFSIEWARVESKPGEFNEAAIRHYVDMAASLRRAGITPVVALWHFTFPSWLSNMADVHKHGWFHPEIAERWEIYVRRMVTALAPHVETFAPQNEPNAYALAVMAGYFPPAREASYSWYLECMDREARAFQSAARIIREIRPESRIISIQNIIHWHPDGFDFGNFWYKMALEYNYYHLDQVADVCDWIGFNYYLREIASPLMMLVQSLRGGENFSDIGWPIAPEGLAAEIVNLSSRYAKPLLITENGIADRSDRKRVRYLSEHLATIRHCIEVGYDVRGYFHWTLIDDYEWFFCYQLYFGLYSIDRKTRAIAPKSSAALYRALARSDFMETATSRPADAQSTMRHSEP